MSITRSPAERRMIEAVLIVLAGCQKSAEVRSSDNVLATTTTTTTTTATPPPLPSTMGGNPSPAVVPDVALAAEKNPQQLCAQYREKIKVDTSRIGELAISTSFVMLNFDSATWDANKNVVICVVTRSQEEMSIEIMYEPPCCPSGGGQCSPPHKRRVPGQRLVVERAEVHPDGRIASSVLEVHGVVPHQPQQYCGRQPEGLVLSAETGAAPGIGPSSVGNTLAHMAELEAASVPAFERLERELIAHRAPARLARRAGAAARDEIRHARMLKRLANERGATVGTPSHRTNSIRDLVPIAIENAVEGCVREAYGALVASFQAERANAPLRATFGSVAKDERAHAALAEDLHVWLCTQIDAAAKAEVDAARSAARVQLRASLVGSAGCETLGLPGQEDALALFDAYFS